jgi:hypothetical protein
VQNAGTAAKINWPGARTLKDGRRVVRLGRQILRPDCIVLATGGSYFTLGLYGWRLMAVVPSGSAISIVMPAHPELLHEPGELNLSSKKTTLTRGPRVAPASKSPIRPVAAGNPT